MMKLNKLAVLGPGLLGGSIIRAAHARGLCKKIALWGRRDAPLLRAKAEGLAHQISTEPGPAVRGADLVILATPIGVMPDLVQRILPDLTPETIVTDVGSVKTLPEETLAPLLRGKARWIGSHPMAGSHETGLEASRADLFENAMVILTPTPATSANTLTEIQTFWEALGARTISLTPKEHDAIVACISHLPHLLASTIVSLASDDMLPLCGGGFRDTTRVAAGPPAMWAEILLTNRKPIREHLGRFRDMLDKVEQLLVEQRHEELVQWLEVARQRRQSLHQIPQARHQHE